MRRNKKVKVVVRPVGSEADVKTADALFQQGKVVVGGSRATLADAIDTDEPISVSLMEVDGRTAGAAVMGAGPGVKIPSARIIGLTIADWVPEERASDVVSALTITAECILEEAAGKGYLVVEVDRHQTMVLNTLLEDGWRAVESSKRKPYRMVQFVGGWETDGEEGEDQEDE